MIRFFCGTPIIHLFIMVHHYSIYLCFYFFFYCPCIIKAQRILPCYLVWNKAKHCAFTSLIEKDGVLYLAFREGANHVDKNGDNNGIIRVLKSDDGSKWKSISKIKINDSDLRDPQFFISQDGLLNMSFVAAKYKNGHSTSFHTHVSKMEYGRFRKSYRLHTPYKNDWLWKLHCFNGKIYGFNYINSFSLLSSENEVNFDQVKSFSFHGKATESDFISIGDSVIVVVRKDKSNGMIGYGSLADGDVRWHDLGIQVAAPCLLKVDSDTILLFATQLLENRQRALRIFKINGISLKLVGTIPSNADCGYMGAAVLRNQLYISYYSTIDKGNVAVFVATIPLSEIV